MLPPCKRICRHLSYVFGHGVLQELATNFSRVRSFVRCNRPCANNQSVGHTLQPRKQDIVIIPCVI